MKDVEQRLFIGSLPLHYNEENLKRDFKPYGVVQSAEVKRKRVFDDEEKVFAFVTLKGDSSNIEKGMQALSKHYKVEYAKENFIHRFQQEIKNNKALQQPKTAPGDLKGATPQEQHSKRDDHRPAISQSRPSAKKGKAAESSESSGSSASSDGSSLEDDESDEKQPPKRKESSIKTPTTAERQAKIDTPKMNGSANGSKAAPSKSVKSSPESLPPGDFRFRGTKHLQSLTNRLSISEEKPTLKKVSSNQSSSDDDDDDDDEDGDDEGGDEDEPVQHSSKHDLSKKSDRSVDKEKTPKSNLSGQQMSTPKSKHSQSRPTAMETSADYEEVPSGYSGKKKKALSESSSSEQETSFSTFAKKQKPNEKTPVSANKKEAALVGSKTAATSNRKSPKDGSASHEKPASTADGHPSVKAMSSPSLAKQSPAAKPEQQREKAVSSKTPLSANKATPTQRTQQAEKRAADVPAKSEGSAERERTHKVEDNEKRLASLRQKKQLMQTQKAAIRQSLTSSQSKKTKFDSDAEEEPTTAKGKKKDSSQSKHGLFSDEDEDEEMESSVDAFRIRPQFESEKGQKLFELQSRFGNDPRFRMDERFVDGGDKEDGEDDGDDGDAESEEEGDIEAAVEKEKSMKILEEVLGYKVANDTPKAQKKQVVSQMVRYDPTKEDHKVFERTPEASTKGQGKGKKKDEDAPVPVDKSHFFRVEEGLTETLTKKETFQFNFEGGEAGSKQGGGTGFQFGFGEDESDEEEEEEEREVAKKQRVEHDDDKMDYRNGTGDAAESSEEEAEDDSDDDRRVRKIIKNPMEKEKEYSSSDPAESDEDAERDVEDKELPSAVKTEFFFSETDPRLEEGTNYLKNRDARSWNMEWKALRVSLIETYRTKRKRAMSRAKQDEIAKKMNPKKKFKRKLLSLG